MENPELDNLLSAYKNAIEHWIVAIRHEESLATPAHSMSEWETWDQADLKEESARDDAKAAREAYADALRKKLLNF